MNIYHITNNVNGKKYIGQTITSITRRCVTHFSSLRGGYHPNTHLQRAFDQYGQESFTTGSLASGLKDEDELTKWETFYVDLYRSMDREKGYNLIRPGRSGYRGSQGFTGRTHTEESKQGMSQPGATNPFYGRTHSEDKRHEDSLRKRNGVPFPVLLSPDGTRHEVYPSLTTFAKNHNLSRNGLHKLMTGAFKQLKGWTICTDS